MPTSSIATVQEEVSDDRTGPASVPPPRLLSPTDDRAIAGDRSLALALARAVQAYRVGCRSSWAPVVLTLMVPALDNRLRHLHPVPPAIGSDDIRQQLLMEVLEAAVCMPLPEDPLVLERAIIRRASQAVSRRLGRELRRQDSQVPVLDEEI